MQTGPPCEVRMQMQGENAKCEIRMSSQGENAMRDENVHTR